MTSSANKRFGDDEVPPASGAGDVELSASGRSDASGPPGEATSLLNKARKSLKHIGPPIRHVRGFVDDFQEFIQQGNMIDLAVGLILGKSFTAILDSFVGDILSPILSLFSDKSLANYYVVARCPPLAMHCTSNTWPTWQAARGAGAVTVNYGQFTENFLNFLIYALFLYIAIKKVLEVLFQRTIVMKRQCPACKEFVRGNATVCKECGHYFMPKGSKAADAFDRLTFSRRFAWLDHQRKMNHHGQERPSCRGCRILRAELVRCQRESEARAAQDAQQCLTMYDHMERLARLNISLTQQRKTTGFILEQPPMMMIEKLRQEEVVEDEKPERVQRLQATIVQQAQEMERLKRTLKSCVPMLRMDGRANTLTRSEEDLSSDDESEYDTNQEETGDSVRRRRRRGLEKLPLTSLHAQLRARDATIHRLEQHIAELTQALDASRENKHHAITHYQQLTRAQQTQLKKSAARIDEQQRMQREGQRELEGLKAYVDVLEKKVLAKRLLPHAQPSQVRMASSWSGNQGHIQGGRLKDA